MIITCPHCQTKYQVAFEAIGSAGRKVQCAHCHQAWQQTAQAEQQKASQDDAPVDAIAEDAMDDAMAAEEQTARLETRREPAEASSDDASSPRALPVPDAAELKKRQKAFSRRQNAMTSRLPLARLRRGARIAGAILLFALVSGAYFARVQIVERYPSMAGLYSAIGLSVNVVGLDFAEVETTKAMSGSNEVLMVSAQIVGLTNKPVRVPPVVISLLDTENHVIYEWSVAPRVRDLMAGERASFDTRLTMPPNEAMRVRLSFAGVSGAPSEWNESARGTISQHADAQASPGASAGR